VAKDYVEFRNGSYYIVGSRVSLSSIVHAYLRGEEAEEIAASFPAVSAEDVYGAIAYYLAHQATIDQAMEEETAEIGRLRDEARGENPAFYARLAAARRNRTKPAA
jgi:uncharacterized protein (DUF433 family)